MHEHSHVPEHLLETVQAILRGGYDKVAEAEAIVVGGHTIKDDTPQIWPVRLRRGPSGPHPAQ